MRRGGRRRELHDLADDLLVQVFRLLDIDVNDLVVILEIDAGVMAMETTAGRNVAAAHDVAGLIEVDVALDVRGHIIGDPCRIIGDEKAHWNFFAVQHFGEGDRGIATH